MRRYSLVGHENMYTVFCILFIISFGFKNEFFQDAVVSCHNTIKV